MRTEQLIQALSADSQPDRRVEGILPVALFATGLVVGGAFLAIAGVRPDLVSAITEMNVLLKQAFPWVLALGGLGTVLCLSRPGATPGGWIWLLLAAPAAIILAMLWEMMRLPPETWGSTAMGHSAVTCLLTIPALSLPVACVCLWILRRGAPTRPALCGAAAGLMCAGMAAGMYAFFCTDDSPMFFGIWYVAGIALVTVVSGLVGARILRW